MKFHPEKIWKKTPWYINSTTLKSTQISACYPLKPHSMQYCWKKTVQDLHYTNYNRQGETHGVSENQSTSNFKHPSDSILVELPWLFAREYQNTLGTYSTYLWLRAQSSKLHYKLQIIEVHRWFNSTVYIFAGLSYTVHVFCFHRKRNTSTSIQPFHQL